MNKKLFQFLSMDYIRQQQLQGIELVNDEGVIKKLSVMPLSFYEKLQKRADTLITNSQVGVIKAPVRYYKHYSAVLAVVVFIAGIFASQQILFSQQSQSSNFFWILLGFLGFNLVSLAIWVIVNSSSKTGLLSGSFLSNTILLRVQAGFFKALHNPQAPEFLAWKNALNQPSLLRWQLSIVTHGLWLVFFIATILMVGLMLSTRQFDFVWETTILHESVFVSLSQYLAYFPDLLGIAVPSDQQVLASRLGADRQAVAISGSDELRVLWSNLLLASLLLYGLLPRLLFFIFSIYKRHRAYGDLMPDLHGRYYQDLRQRLMPSQIAEGIVDADEAPLIKSVCPVSEILDETALRNYQGSISCIGMEWGSGWQRAAGALLRRYRLSADLTGDMFDRRSREAVMSAVQASKPDVIWLMARLSATPDRGVVHCIKLLSKLSSQLVVLLVEPQSVENLTAKKEDWQEAVLSAGLAKNCLCYLSAGDAING